MSCLAVTIGRSKLLADVGITDGTPKATLLIDKLNSLGNISILSSVGTADIVKPKVKADIDVEIVCGIDSSLMVLCSSDGELITIDGKYIIVRRDGQVLS